VNRKIIIALVLLGISMSFLSMGCIDESQPSIVEIPKEINVSTPTPTPEIIETTPTPTPGIIEIIPEIIETTPTPTPTPTTTIPEHNENERLYYTYFGEKQYAEWGVGDGISLYCIETGKDIGWYYEMNIFDCSEMSAAYERAFENAGYNAKIARGNAYGAWVGHAWVMVEKADNGDGVNWLWFEATNQHFMAPETYKEYLDECNTFDNINEALEWNNEDYNWWEELEDFNGVIWI
jgi:hypothetical protein